MIITNSKTKTKYTQRIKKRKKISWRAKLALKTINSNFEKIKNCCFFLDSFIERFHQNTLTVLLTHTWKSIGTFWWRSEFSVHKNVSGGKYLAGRQKNNIIRSQT